MMATVSYKYCEHAEALSLFSPVLPCSSMHLTSASNILVRFCFTYFEHVCLVLSDLARIAGICLRNATEHNAAKLEITRSQVGHIKMSKPNHFAIWRQILIFTHAQVFLDLARVIFEQQTSVEFTVLKILVNFLLLIECKRAQVRIKYVIIYRHFCFMIT
jgi:hypothetical protein